MKLTRKTSIPRLHYILNIIYYEQNGEIDYSNGRQRKREINIRNY